MKEVLLVVSRSSFFFEFEEEDLKKEEWNL